MLRIYCYLICVGILCCCNASKNDKQAYLVRKGDQLFLKLTGKRVLRPNSPDDIVTQKTYSDSFLIAVPAFKDGILKGENIIVEKGTYPYQGDIVIKGKEIEVALLVNNYDDKKLTPLTWNGKYQLSN